VVLPRPKAARDVTADVRVGGPLSDRHARSGRRHPRAGRRLPAIEPDSRLVFTWTCPELGSRTVSSPSSCGTHWSKTELIVSHRAAGRGVHPARAPREAGKAAWRAWFANWRHQRRRIHRSSIKEKMIIRGNAEKVFGALTSPAGYRGWWSKDCEIAEKPGAESKLKSTRRDHRDDALPRRRVVPNRSVRWTCVAHDMESWIGTTLSWDLAPEGNATEVSFEPAAGRATRPSRLCRAGGTSSAACDRTWRRAKVSPGDRHRVAIRDSVRAARSEGGP